MSSLVALVAEFRGAVDAQKHSVEANLEPSEEREKTWIGISGRDGEMGERAEIHEEGVVDPDGRLCFIHHDLHDGQSRPDLPKHFRNCTSCFQITLLI